MASDNERVVRGFLDYLKVEKGLAGLTVGAYHSDLMQFSEFLESRRRNLARARRDDVRGFLSHLFANGVRDRSVARKLSTLRHFYKYLLLDRLVKHDPTLEIDSPRQWKVLPKSLAGSEIDAMVNARSTAAAIAASEISVALAQRDTALLEVLYAAGLRVSEVIHVRLEDLKLELGHVLVRGKGDKERLVPLGRAAQVSLGIYLEDGRKTLLNGRISPMVFDRLGGGSVIQKPLLPMGRTASSSFRHASPPLLRHNLPTHLVEN